MDITSSNAQVLITVPLIYPTPQQLSKFAADDIYGTDPLSAGEVVMGVDGYLTAGKTNVPVVQKYMLLADSESNDIFDRIFNLETVNQRKYPINGVILLTSVGKKFTMTRGFLTIYQPIPDAKRVLQARTHTITWQSVVPSPAS
jgi:hypothetical protein